ncbi:cadherin repeat domain-containing protein [Microvirga calopogonii]|uniref:cadherin repeat domain-containing protein n=1 Tax=Microvirga calopogonii TaxID=2078013 RepID=UPI000E0D4237|nr:cadherin repeat domain-containing protein [Microvirga calopogonii]
MNKPVFDKVTGKPVKVSNAIDETFPGNAGRTEAAKPALDFMTDELDGRRSIVVDAAPVTTSSSWGHATSSIGEASSSAPAPVPGASSAIDDGNGDFLAVSDATFDFASSQSDGALFPQQDKAAGTLISSGDEEKVVVGEASDAASTASFEAYPAQVGLLAIEEPETDPPTDLRFTGSTTISESIGLGTRLGRLLANDVSSYSFSGGNAGIGVKSFSAGTWDLYVKDPSLLNYENLGPDKTFSVTVRATDKWGNPSEPLIVTFTITDAPEPPTDLSLSISEIDENSPLGTFAGNLSGTSNEGGPLEWMLIDPAGQATFRIVNNGTNNAYLEVINPAALDYENYADHNFSFQMRAKSVDGATVAFKTFTLRLNDKNDAPRNLQVRGNSFLGSIDETNQAGTVLASISVVDELADKPNLQFTMSGLGAQYFDFSSTNGYITGLKLKQGAHIDLAEHPNGIPVTVTVYDPSTNTTLQQSVTFGIWNINEKPEIHVAPGTERTISSSNDAIAMPFTGVTLFDPDDLDAPQLPQVLTLTIAFNKNYGDLTNADAAVDVITGDTWKYYKFQGTAEALQYVLQHLGYNPADGQATSTHFDILLSDGFETVANQQIHVDAALNHAPTLTIDSGEELVYMSDDGPAMRAFELIWVGDADGDDLTLTISFLKANGALGIPNGVAFDLADGGTTRTYTFHGSATFLEDLLSQLTWNQTDGVLSNTRFTLTLSDGNTTVTNNMREVVINAAPTIDFADGTRSTAAVDNGNPVKPFRGIDLNDRENDWLTVTISFTEDHGVLAGATGATTFSDPMTGLKYYVFHGRANDLDAILRNVTFDPRNGFANTTPFHISVEDATHTPILDEVQVITSTASGNTNAAPTITVAGSGVTPATDTGAPVSPFAGVTLFDAVNDALTVTVSFDPLHGFLLNSPVNGISDGHILTYTFRGTYADVQNILQGLKFDPLDGQANETVFKITVKDNSHQAITNSQIKVVTEIAGGAGSNHAPDLYVVEGLKTVPATDTGTPVNPFVGVRLTDQDGDTLTVTLAFTNSHGALGNLDTTSPLYSGTTLNGDLRTYFFQGTASELQSLLQGLSFNPTDGVANTTQFSITAKDALHQAVENHDIRVETSVSGGAGTNLAPTIRIVGEATTYAQDNGAAVYPFMAVRLNDTENDWLTVTVTFQDTRGVLGNAEFGTSVLDPISGFRTYTFTGRAGFVEGLLHNLTFNPTDNSASNGNITTGFTITVKDEQHQAVGNNAIQVVTQHGSGTNMAPWISVAGTGVTNATDTGAPVKPFANASTTVDLFDYEDNWLTLTVSFRRADGELRNTSAANGISDLGEIRTYIFSGRAEDLETILNNLTFDPTDGVANTTTFTLGLQDGYHEPVTNRQVQVVTSLGTSTTNTPPRITVDPLKTTWNIADIQTTKPFDGIDLVDDQNDDLTVTASFLDARGALSMAAITGVTITDNGASNPGGIRSFTLGGKADNIEQVLKLAIFDPADGTTNSTRFTISVKDATHQAVSNQDIVVNSTVASAPSAPTWDNGQLEASIPENSTGVLPFHLTATDPNGDPIHYVAVAMPGDDNAYFVIAPDGQISVASTQTLDFENKSTYTIYVRAVDTNGNEGIVQQLKINLLDKNEALTNATFNVVSSIAENAPPITTVVATVASVDDPDLPGPNENFVFSLVQSNGQPYTGPFQINAATGQITVSGTLPDVSTPTPMTLWVKIADHGGVSDASGASFNIIRPITFTINPVDVIGTKPTDPTIVNNFVGPLTDDAWDEMGVARVHSDAPSGHAVTYELENTYGNLFTVDSDGSVFFSGTVNYETAAGVTVVNAGQATEQKYFLLRIRAKDTVTGEYSQNYTDMKVYINDVNEVPEASYTPVSGVVVGAGDGTRVASIAISDPDTRPTFRDFHYQLVTDATGNTAYTGTDFGVDVNGNIVVNGALTAGTKTLFVKITDGIGTGANTIIQSVTIQIGNAAPNTPPEAPEVNTVVGIMTLTDDMAYSSQVIAQVHSNDDGQGGSITYELENRFGLKFTVLNSGRIIYTGNTDYDATTNGLTVVNAGQANEEKYFLLRVRAKETVTGNTSDWTEVKVYVQDVNEAPQASYTPVDGIVVGTQTGIAVANITISDPDTRPTFRDFHYRLVTSQTDSSTYAGTDFRVDASGNIVVNGALTAGNKTLYVEISDGVGAAANTFIQAVTVNVGDGNIAPVIVVDAGGTTEWGPIGDTSTVQPFHDVSFQDDDFEPGDVVTVFISLDGANGIFTSALDLGVQGVDYVYDPLSDPYTFMVRGSLSWVNQIVKQLTFNPTDQYVGSQNRITQFAISMTDGDGVSANPLTVTVEDTPANVAPTLTIDNDAEHFAVLDNGQGSAGVVKPFIGLDLDDSENNTIFLKVTFDGDNGTLGIPSTSGTGVTVGHTNPNSQGFVTYTFSGKAADLEAFLDAVTFDASNNSAAGGLVTTTFTFALTDGLHPLANAPESVTVVTESSANGRPTITFAEGTRETNATDNGLSVYPFRGIDVGDPESNQLTVKISFLVGRGGLIDQDGNTLLGNETEMPGRVTYTFFGTPDALDVLLRGLRFNPTNDQPGDTQITVSVSDAWHLPTSESVTVHTSHGDDSGNHAPTIDIVLGTETTQATSDGPAVYPFRGVDIADAENDVLTLTISVALGTGSLTGAGLPAPSIGGNGFSTYILTGTADALNAILHGISFNPADGQTSTDPITTSFSISVQDANHAPVTDSVDVVTSQGGQGTTNLPPVIDIAAGTETTDATDNGSAVYLFRGVDIIEQDNDSIVLTIKFNEADGQLSGFGSRQVITSLVNGIRTYIVTGTQDELDAFLHDLAFNPANDLALNASSGVDTIFDISVQDAFHPPYPAQVTVHTRHGTDAANAQPTVAFFPGTQVTPATDDGPAVAPFRGIDLTDTDNDLLVVKVSFDSDLGTLTGWEVDPDVVLTYAGSIATFTFTGRADEIESILQALRYDPDQDTPAHHTVGQHVITISVQDATHPSVTTTATVNVTDGGSAGDVNNNPSAPAWSGPAPSILETASAGSPVGTLNASDQDTGDTVTIGFWYNNALHQVSQDNRFLIDNGVVKVLNAAVDQNSDLYYVVRSVDTHGGFAQSTISIHVDDVDGNQAPIVDGVSNGSGAPALTIGFLETLQATQLGGADRRARRRQTGRSAVLLGLYGYPVHPRPEHRPDHADGSTRLRDPDHAQLDLQRLGEGPAGQQQRPRVGSQGHHDQSGGRQRGADSGDIRDVCDAPGRRSG